MASAERGVRQRAYRVLVASRPELVREGRADVWDSQRGRVLRPLGRLRRSGPGLAHPLLLVGSRLGRRLLASDWAPPTWFETAFLGVGEWQGQWIAGPERPPVRTAAEGEADDAAIRAAGEFCRPVRWLTRGFAVARNTNDQGECREVRPAPMLRKSFQVDEAGHPGPRLLVGPGLQRPDAQRAPRLRERARPRLHRLQPDRSLHDPRRHGPPAPGRERDRLRAGIGPLRRRDADVGLGMGQGPVAGDAAAAARPPHHLRRRVRAGGGFRRLLEGHRRRPDPLRQLLPGRDLRRAARDPGLEPARLRRLGLGRGPGRERAGGRPARADSRAHPRRRHAAAGHAIGARAGRLRLRHRPEPHRLGGDPGRRSRRHRRRGLLLGEARRATARPAPSATTSSSASCRPTTTWRRARATSAGRRGSATRASSTCSSAVPSGAPLPAGRVGHGRARSAGANGPPRHRDLRVQQRDAQPDPPEHRVGRPEQPARHRHRHPGLREERLDGRRAAHRGNRLAPVRHRAALPEDVPGHARRPDRAGRGAAPGAEQPELRLRRQAVVQAGRLLRRHPGLGRVLVRDPVGELPAPRQPGGARGDVPGDAEVPGRLDTRGGRARTAMPTPTR